MNYFHVLLKHVPQLLTYCSEEKISPGSLIQVKLGKRTVNGVVIEAVQKPEYECVEICKIHLSEAISPPQIELCLWMSSYYCASFQRCIQLFLPSPIWNQKILPKYEEFLELSIPIEKALEKTKRAKKQQELISLFSQENKWPLSDLKKQVSPSIVGALLKKKIIKKSFGELINPDQNHASKAHHDQPLTEEQEKVLETILASGNEKHRAIRNKEFLLHGITGSGKTEIYLQLIRKSIEEGKQCVLLVPEIALTTEVIQYFSKQFPEQISIVHSKRSERERVQTWHRIHSGKTKLILGSRSALFTPWKNLGNIIIDEEHEWTYKQESSPRYHVKKVAQYIVNDLQLTEAPKLLLGSATPSLESYFEAKNDKTSPLKHQLLNLTHRANASSLPPRVHRRSPAGIHEKELQHVF